MNRYPEEQKSQPFTITKEVVLEHDEFKAFARGFLEDQPWILPSDGGITPEGDIRCIQVRNTQTGEAVLVNNEGFPYARYTGIEI